MTKATRNLVIVLGLTLPLLGCGWKEVSSKEGRFKVQMPGTPKEKSESTPFGNLKMLIYEEKNGAYMAGHFDLPGVGEESPEMTEKRLNGAQAGAVGNINAKLTSSSKITLDRKHSGRDFAAELPAQKGMVRARIYIVGPRLYQIMAMGTKPWVESSNTKKFLDSFALTN